MIFQLDVVRDTLGSFRVDFLRGYAAESAIGVLSFLSISGGNIELLRAEILCLFTGEKEQILSDTHSSVVG